MVLDVCLGAGWRRKGGIENVKMAFWLVSVVRVILVVSFAWRWEIVLVN